MSSVRTCPECGSELPPGVAPWLCPRCLLGQATNDVADRPVALAGSGSTGPPGGEAAGEVFPQHFGGYELLARIGQGGMGIVYKARQISLDRIVAVKLLPLGALATKEQVLRFRTEAAAAGSLQHPNVVAIHEVGLCEDRHYLVMDFVEGQNLAELARAGPLRPARAARYVQKMAEAIHCAHERGILHRDLKPSNVLIDAAGQPHITDFGLAKRLESGTDLTVSGQVLGSPQYMPPEQATGRPRQVGRRSDVYALGAVLYHLLTGRPPFVGETLSDILPQVVNDEPLRPRQLTPAVPSDLETVCLKCLEKEIARRYPSALALAEELGRFLRGEPILARPVSVAGKVWRWCRRKPQVASLTGVAALAVVLGFAGVLWQWRQAETQRRRAEQQAYISDVNAAQAALKANNPARALELLNCYWPANSSLTRQSPLAPGLRGWEWRYLWQQCQTDTEATIGKVSGGVRALEVSSDGHWLVASSESGAVKLWDLLTGEEIALLAANAIRAFATFSPDSRWLLFTDQSREDYGNLAVWDLEARKRLAPIKDPHPIGTIGFSPDGRWLGVGLNISPEARGLMILDFATRTKVRERPADTGVTDEMHGFDWVFVPNRPCAISSENDPDRRLCLWDFSTAQTRECFPAHREAITAMAISRDGRTLATGAGWTEKNINLWEIPSFRPVAELTGHTGWIAALSFSPDGQTLASASADQTIRLWHLPTREPIRVFSRLPSPVWRLCFTPDGRKLLSGSSDGRIERWPVEARPSEAEAGFSRLQPELDFVTAAPDGTQFGGIRQGKTYLGNTEAPGRVSELPILGTNNNCLLFSPDGRALYAGTETGVVQVWSVAGRALLRCVRCRPEPVLELLQDRAGRRLVVRQSKRAFVWPPYHVGVWDTHDWQPQATSLELSANEFSPAVSPDGGWFATGRYGGPVRLRSLSGPCRTNELAFTGQINGLAFSPDGRLLAAATQAGVVRVWDLPTCQEVKELRARSQALFAITFSPDSRRLATAGEGKEAIKLWDVATWQELITLERPGESLRQLAFSAHGNRLIARNSQGDVLTWRVPSLVEIEAAENNSNLH